RRLHDVAVAPADIFFNLDDDLAIGKELGAAAPQRNLQIIADFLGQDRIGPAGEELEFVGVGVHAYCVACNSAVSEVTFPATVVPSFTTVCLGTIANGPI